MKLELKQAREIMVIHYLPGLRIARDVLDAEIAKLEGKVVVETIPEDAEGEDEVRDEKVTKSFGYCPKCKRDFINLKLHTFYKHSHRGRRQVKLNLKRRV